MATSAVSSTSVSNVTGTMSSAGIGSGLDVNSIVTQLMAAEKKPLTQLQNRASDLSTTLSEVGKLQSGFATLRDKASALTSLSLWNGTTATSSDAASVTVSTSADNPATAGSYAVSVARLATAQNLTSEPMAAGSTLSAGTLTIELGSWDGGAPPTGFTPKSGASPVSITIGDGDTSLTAVRDRINAAGAGVVASIVTDASGQRLSLRSKDTGAENAFRVTVAEAHGDSTDAEGLSALAYDPVGGVASMARNQSAGDAQLTLNGVSLSSASNTLTNAVDGMSLTLNKVTTTDVAITVAADTASAKKAITDFVSSFNALATLIRNDTAYNADNKTAGPLQGDQSTLSLQHQLRSIVNTPSTASGSFSVLSDIGIAMASDGTLSVNAAKLDNALGNMPELKKLLSADAADMAGTGFIRRFRNLADAALATGGAFDSRTSGLRTTLDRNGKQQDAMQNRLAATEARLRAQYQALDTKMAQISGLQTYIGKLTASTAVSNG